MTGETSFRQIKKQNGEAFAQTIRGFDSSIFEIPNLARIVRFAGRDARGLLDYLESLKQVFIAKMPSFENPFELLDRAGYDAYLVDSLEKQNAISKYFEKNEMICTFQDAQRYLNYYIIHCVKKNVDEIKRADFKGKEERHDAYGTSVISIQILKRGGFIKITNRYNHTVDGCDNTFYSNPDNIIEGLSAALAGYFNVDFSSSKLVDLPCDCLLFDGMILKYYKEINNIYFGNGFYLKEGKLYLVHKDYQLQVDELLIDLKEKKVLNPAGVSHPLELILTEELKNETLQVKKEGDLSVLYISQGPLLKVENGCLKEITLYKTKTLPEKSFYRHKTVEKISAPNVSLCLTDCFCDLKSLKELYLPSLERYLSGFLSNTRCKVIADRLKSKGVYFFDSVIIDTNLSGYVSKNPIQSRGYLPSLLAKMLNKEMYGKKVSYEKDGSIFKILLEGRDFLIFRENNLVEMHLTSKVLETGCIANLPDLEVFSAQNMTTVETYNLFCCPNLKRVYLENVEELEGQNLSSCPNLEEVYAPKLKKVGYMSLSKNRSLKKLKLENLRSVSTGCFSQSGYEVLELENLMNTGTNFCSSNPNLTRIHCPKLRYIEEYSFSSLDRLEELDLPELNHYMGRYFMMNNKNLKIVRLNKLMAIPSFMLDGCDALEEVYCEKVHCLEKSALSNHKNLTFVYAPSLIRVSLNALTGCPKLNAVLSPWLPDNFIPEKIASSKINISPLAERVKED